MKVSVLAEQLRRPVPGGIGTYAGGLLQGLRTSGASGISLLATRAPVRPVKHLPTGSSGSSDPLSQLGFPLRTIGLPSAAFTRLADLGLVVLRPGGRWLESDISVVHSVSSLTVRVERVALTATVHDLAWRRFPETFPRRGRAWHEAALRRVAGRAERIVVPSDATAADLLGAGLGVAPDRIVVIPEGVDHLAPLDNAARSAAASVLAALGLGSRHYLLCVGTLEPRKNLHRLLEAYELAASRLRDPPALVVVGPKGWGRRLRPPPGAVLAGRVTDVELTGLYAGAIALAYVPLAEGFGLPAAEAMSLGVPVVAGPEVPSAAGAAVEADPWNTESIAAALRRVVVDDDARREAVAKGRERSAAYRWEVAAGAHARMWEELSGRG